MWKLSTVEWQVCLQTRMDPWSSLTNPGNEFFLSCLCLKAQPGKTKTTFEENSYFDHHLEPLTKLPLQDTLILTCALCIIKPHCMIGKVRSINLGAQQQTLNLCGTG